MEGQSPSHHFIHVNGREAISTLPIVLSFSLKYNSRNDREAEDVLDSCRPHSLVHPLFRCHVIEAFIADSLVSLKPLVSPFRVSLKTESVMSLQISRDAETLQFGCSRDYYSAIGPCHLLVVDFKAGYYRRDRTGHIFVGWIKRCQRST
ncbi:hypothetical protein TNCV_1440011 [Trichonephila clavipes]|nr:hypothetical protein TNCV_1440011 [Trichonephila clavipes]